MARIKVTVDEGTLDWQTVNMWLSGLQEIMYARTFPEINQGDEIGSFEIVTNKERETSLNAFKETVGWEVTDNKKMQSGRGVVISFSLITD